MTPRISRNSSWIGFIDLLGTKDSAKVRRTDFPSKIKRFNSIVREQAGALNAATKVRFFSDCAYIECEDGLQLIEFARRIRWILFAEEIFFKSAIAQGTLDDVPSQESKGGRGKPIIDISGSSFGEAAVYVYYAQEDFKGIGFTVDSEYDARSIGKELVNSCFLGNREGRTQWKSFHDIRFSEAEIGGLISSHDDRLQTHKTAFAFLDHILSAALRANNSSRGLSRYYLSCVMTVIQSSNFERVSISDNKFDKIPVVFSHMLEGRKKRQSYMSIMGADALFFALANRIFSAKSLEDKQATRDDFEHIADHIVYVLSELKLLAGPIPQYPSFVLTPENREHIIRRAVNLRIRD